MRVKAGMLLYAIIVSVLLVTAATSFVSITGLKTIDTTRWLLREKVMNECLQRILMNLHGINNGESNAVTERYWGMYKLITSSAAEKDITYSFSALTTSSSDYPINFYIPDHGKPLYVSGHVTLTGNLYLPLKGTRNAYIDNSFINHLSILSDNITQSGPSIPELSNDLITTNTQYLGGESLASDSIITMKAVPDMFSQSFDRPTALLRFPGDLELTHSTIKGNVIISVNGSCFIGKNTHLEDILIYARNIYIENGFSGSIHLVASDTLRTGENVSLSFPSSAVVVRTESSPEKILFHLGKNSTIEGFAGGWQKSNSRKDILLVTTGKGSKVEGTLYSSGGVNLHGNITGTMIGQKLVHISSSYSLDHHLINTSIEKEQDSLLSRMSFLPGELSKKEIIKWL